MVTVQKKFGGPQPNSRETGCNGARHVNKQARRGVQIFFRPDNGYAEATFCLQEWQAGAAQYGGACTGAAVMSPDQTFCIEPLALPGAFNEGGCKVMGRVGSVTGEDDVDHCAAGTHNCDAQATCTHQAGGFTCECNAGFFGPGTSCAPVTVCGADVHVITISATPAVEARRSGLRPTCSFGFGLGLGSLTLTLTLSLSLSLPRCGCSGATRCAW